MKSCQVKIFQTIVESPIPLTTNNLLQMLPYSEDSIRKSITNLRKKGLIESTGYRYFLTDAGKEVLQNDPHLLTLDNIIGSYVRSKRKLDGSAFIEFITEEAVKTEYGRYILENANLFANAKPIISALAPFVAYFAIQAGLITESKDYYSNVKGNFGFQPTQEELEFDKTQTGKYNEISKLFMEIVELVDNKPERQNFNLGK